MLETIDGFLNRITMYRLVLYYLAFLLCAAAVFGFFGILPYGFSAVLFSAFFLVVVSWVTNELCARIFEVQPNVESTYITALILALIITPVEPTNAAKIGFLIWAAIWATASKYVLSANRKHLFNPAAFAVALTAFTINQSASWWAGGNLPMAAFVIIGGLLVVRKMQRFDLVSSFFAASLFTVAATSNSPDIVSTLQKALLHAPFFFFAFVMLTEPLTTPPTRTLRIFYGALVGFLFAPAIHVGGVYSTPELSLLAGNVFSYLVSPKKKYVFKLLRKERAAAGIYDFILDAGEKVGFKAGQYLEWTLAHDKPDSRGNRRYFTVASSPTEKETRLGVKFYDYPSSFKKKMISLEPGDKIFGGQPAGDFTLPSDTEKKLAFIAGGIGITPFRSMAKYLSDRNERRDVVLLYSSREASETAYKNIFDEAASKTGMRTVYVLTGGAARANAGVKAGKITEETIKSEIPDYHERIFYVSGTHEMVDSMKKILRGMGIKKSRIKTDFFPGLA